MTGLSEVVDSRTPEDGEPQPQCGVHVTISSIADFDDVVWTNKQHMDQVPDVFVNVLYIEALGLTLPTFSRNDLESHQVPDPNEGNREWSTEWLGSLLNRLRSADLLGLPTEQPTAVG